MFWSRVFAMPVSIMVLEAIFYSLLESAETLSKVKKPSREVYLNLGTSDPSRWVRVLGSATSAKLWAPFMKRIV